MINREKFNEHIKASLKGSRESIAVVREVLRPLATNTADEIYEKLRLYNRLIFIKSMKHEDSQAHKDIDMAYARQIHSFLVLGIPFYKAMIIIGYRESAKTTRVKFNDSYLSLYLPQFFDYTNVVSVDGESSNQFNMDMFNMFAFSKVSLYFPEVISSETRSKKKESQTMSKFTTSTGVTYAASSARKTKRGSVKMEIDDEGEIETKRPKKVIFDDIENEQTIRSIVETNSIGNVMSATIDGLDQVTGFWILLGNYLSLRGNIARVLKKYKDDPKVFILMIPIHDGKGSPTWPTKHVRTDKEEAKLLKHGIIRKSIESIERDSDNFDTEFLNNPSRALVYFTDKMLEFLTEYEDDLVQEDRRDESGLLILEQFDPTEVYLIAADAAKGNGGDPSAFVVLKTSGLRFEEVANFKSDKITPEDFAPVLANIGNRFGSALIIPENNYPGNELIAFLRPLYSNIFKVEKGVNKDTGKTEYEYGVNTNIKTKPEMFLNLKKVFKGKLILLRSQILYNQILQYPADDVHVIKQKDGSGGHFDILISLVIGLYKAGTLSVEGKEEETSDAAVQSIVDDIFNKNTSRR